MVCGKSPAKITPIQWLSWNPVPESSVSDSGKSQYSGSLLHKSMENHMKQRERKSIIVIFRIFASETAYKDKVINFSNTNTRADGSRKNNSNVVRTSICLSFCAWWDVLNLIDKGIWKLVLIIFACIAFWWENKKSAQICVCLFFSEVVEFLFMLAIFYYSKDYSFFFLLTVVSLLRSV